MKLDEAKEILKENGYLCERSLAQTNLAKTYFTELDKVLKKNFKNVRVEKRPKDWNNTTYMINTSNLKNVRLEVYYYKYILKPGDKDRFHIKSAKDPEVDVTFHLPPTEYYHYQDVEEFYETEIDKLINWINKTSIELPVYAAKEEAKIARKKQIEAEEKKKQRKAQAKPRKKLKYTDLFDYKQDIYDALTDRGLGMEFALDYVNSLDSDFMLDHQDINALADEAVREWG